MSVQINISRVNGKIVFDDPNPAQNDLVFWRNGDTETHFPVPGCGGLEVAPGATSQPYQYLPVNPTFPLPIVYGCALHPGESGTLTVQADSPPPNPMPAGGTPATKTIAIGRQSGVVTFQEVDVAQIDSVVWKNDDSETHFPVPNCTGLLVKSGAVSNDMQPSPPLVAPASVGEPPPPGPPSLPLTLAYGCAIAGHESERGKINVYNTFLGPPVTSPVTPVALAATKPYAAVQVISGGKSPYAIKKVDTNPSWLSLAETAPDGSSLGVSIVLNGPPQASSVQYQLDVTDALGTNINQQVTIAIAFPTLTAIPGAATIFTQLQPPAPVVMATGGQAPYTLTPDTSYPYITLVETAPAGSSAGISAVLNAQPPAADLAAGTITYNLTASDTAGTQIDQQPITVILIS